MYINVEVLLEKKPLSDSIVKSRRNIIWKKREGIYMSDSMHRINQFRDERNWRQFHNEKDLAISISLEANELLELFQWKTPEESKENLERLKEELADVLIYSYMMADNLGFDIDVIIAEKLIKNARKYPVPKSFAQKKKYNELDEVD